MYVEDEEEEEEVFRSDGEILPMGEGGGREGIFADDGGILLRSVRRVGDVDDDSSADIRYVGGR